MTRPAYLAGTWYPSEETSCRREVERILAAAAVDPSDVPETVRGGLVPHAGWTFSGRTAARTLKALAARDRLGRVVIFGTDHGRLSGPGAVYAKGAWATPLGEVPVDADLAGAVLGACEELTADPDAHAGENSIEIQVPLLKALADDVRIVPVMLSLRPEAAAIGRRVGELLARDAPEASVLGSSDLTHYGPRYRFSPAGAGESGLTWARENDRRIIKLIEEMRAAEVVAEAGERQNACGGGAVAAAIEACSALGATRGQCLEYTTSSEVVGGLETVGYASVIFF